MRYRSQHDPITGILDFFKLVGIAFLIFILKYVAMIAMCIFFIVIIFNWIKRQFED